MQILRGKKVVVDMLRSSFIGSLSPESLTNSIQHVQRGIGTLNNYKLTKTMSSHTVATC